MFADFWGKLASIFKDNPLVEYGLVNEPNNMSTMVWWEIAQKCIDAIRAAGATSNIYVPGNGWTGAASWTADWYDTATPARSNAYGWLNANGEGAPLYDPLGKSIAEVHLYLDENASGGSDELVSPTIARDRLSIAVNEASAQGYQLFVGEIGLCAGATAAAETWQDFIAYVSSQASTCVGFAWWAGGEPAWWHDVHAPHFSISPTAVADGVYSGNTPNMNMIVGDLAALRRVDAD
jgi:endoglucanase